MRDKAKIDVGNMNSSPECQVSSVVRAMGKLEHEKLIEANVTKYIDHLETAVCKQEKPILKNHRVESEIKLLQC